jgi:hypothetical protein
MGQLVAEQLLSAEAQEQQAGQDRAQRRPPQPIGQPAQCAYSASDYWLSTEMYRYYPRLPSLVLCKEYFDCPQRDSNAVHYI